MNEQQSSKPRNVVLVGMTYSGKTTVGREIARTLNMEHLDTDLLLIADQGKPLQQIINDISWKGFLQLEENILMQHDTTAASGTVVSTGGSVIYSSRLLEKYSRDIIINLDIEYNTFAQRMGNTGVNRGMIFPDGVNTAYELYNSRMTLYRQYLSVDNNRTIDDAVSDICTIVRSKLKDTY